MTWKNNFPEKGRFFETENGILYNADSLNSLKDFPEKSIDLTVTSPPYNVEKEYEEQMPWNDYFTWAGKVLEEVYRVTRGVRRMVNLFMMLYGCDRPPKSVKNWFRSVDSVLNGGERGWMR